MTEDTLVELARDGAAAVAGGDPGRSAYLMEQVANEMADLDLSECEWLSIAVTNGAFEKRIHDAGGLDAAIDVRQTDGGEIWDLSP